MYIDDAGDNRSSLKIDCIGVFARQRENVLIAADRLDVLTLNSQGLFDVVIGASSKDLTAVQDRVSSNRFSWIQDVSPRFTYTPF